MLANIKSPEDKLKEIKERINDDSISYDEISCVLATIRGKHKKKSANYFINWYQRTNCFRKCCFNKNRRQECRVKFQQLAAQCADLCFTKNEFLNFFNSHVNICALPEKDKRKYVSWREFRQSIQKKCPYHSLTIPTKLPLLLRLLLPLRPLLVLLTKSRRYPE